jgi:hypothetical protein
VSAPVERELKLVLDSRGSFETLLSKALNQPSAQCVRCALQHNLFFDQLRGDAAPERGSALRMREEMLFHTSRLDLLEALRSEFPGSDASLLKQRAKQSPSFRDCAWELTYKRGKSNQGGYFQASEWNCALEPQVAELFHPCPQLGQEVLVMLERFPAGLEPLEEFRSRFGDSPLRSLGGFYNLRTTVDCLGFSFEFDQTYYQERQQRDCDLEVEVETEHPDKALQCLLQLWGPSAAPWGMQGKTKFQRFLELRTA